VTQIDTAARKVQWERRFQSAMLTIAVAGVIWVVQTLANVDKGMAAILPRINTIEVQISGMYRATDARRDVADMTARIGTTEQRVERIESRLDRVEDAHRRGGR
jgi:uncharacterized protein YoxC